MKLHIPTPLRKALLTCMAAAMAPSFAGFAASGSFIAGAAVVISLCAQQAEAAAKLTSHRTTKMEGEEEVIYSGYIFTMTEAAEGNFTASRYTWYNAQTFPPEDDAVAFEALGSDNVDLGTGRLDNSNWTALWTSFRNNNADNSEYGQTMRFAESFTVGLSWDNMWMGGFIVERGATVNLTPDTDNNNTTRNFHLAAGGGRGSNITVLGTLNFTASAGNSSTRVLHFVSSGAVSVIRVAQGSSFTLDGYSLQVDAASVEIKKVDTGSENSIAGRVNTGVITIASGGTLTVRDGARLTVANSVSGDGKLVLNNGTLNMGNFKDDVTSPVLVDILNLSAQGSDNFILGETYTIHSLEIGNDATLAINSGVGTVEALKDSGKGVSGEVEVSGSNTQLTIRKGGGSSFSGTVSVSNGAVLHMEETLEDATLGRSATLVVSDGGHLELGGNGDIQNKVIVKGGFIDQPRRLQGDVILGMESGSIDLDQIDAKNLHFDHNAGSVTGLRGGSTITFGSYEDENGETQKDSIKLGAANVTREGESGTYFLQFRGNGSIDFEEDGELYIDVDTEVARNMKGKYVLWISNGTISAETMQRLLDEKKIVFDGLLEGMVCRLEQEEGDSSFRLVLDGNIDGIWFASERGNIESSEWDDGLYGGGSWSGVCVDRNMEVKLNLDEEVGERSVVLPQLKGNSGMTLSLKNDGSDLLTVKLDNGKADSNMEGNIQVGDRVRVEKTGAERLTVTGNMTSKGTVVVEEGTLRLEGKKNSIGVLDVKEGAALNVSGTLTLTDDSDLTGGTLEGIGTLALEKSLDLSNAVLGRVLTIDFSNQNAKLTIGDREAQVGGLSGDGSLSLNGDNSNLTISGENKSGSFSFGGKLEVKEGGAGTISVIQGADQEFTGAGHENINLHIGEQVAPENPEDPGASGDGSPLTRAGETGAVLRLSGKSTYGEVMVRNTGKLVVGPNSVVTASSLVLEKDSCLELVIDSNTLDGGDMNNLDAPVKVENKHEDSGSLRVEKGSKLKISFRDDGDGGSILQPGEDLYVRLLDYENLESDEGENYTTGDTFEDKDLKLDDLFDFYYTDVHVEFRNNGGSNDGGVYLTGTSIQGNPFERTANTVNSKVGATMLWDARDALLQTDSPDATLKSVLNAVKEQSKDAPSEANRIMSAVAGSTVTALGSAQRDSMRRQLSRIRQHSNTLGLTPGYQYNDMPYYHTWLEGTSSYSRLRQDGDSAGYKHQSWGGSFGIDADVTERTSLGMSVTALYGDLDADASDTATGHLDSYYLSGIMRTQIGRWGHTFILSGGIDRAKLDRTVEYDRTGEYGSGSYAAKGSTHGWALGAVYEMTYDLPVGEEHNYLFQPLVNLSYVRSFMKGYNENGPSVLNLNVDDQVWDTFTIGIGARWIGTLEETTLERRIQVEFSAMVLQDLADSRGSADVSLQATPGAIHTVYGAEYGRTAVQVGAAFRVPISEQTLIYLNTDAEFRQGNTAWQASLGMRYDF